MIPTSEQCIQVLSDYHVPVRVQQHCRLVARVAVFLAQLLNSKGYGLDVPVIEAAALLHDIARTERDHAVVGADILLYKGFVEIADIVRQHMKPDPEEQGRISEVTVIYLADKYVGDDGIVALEQRFMEKMNVFYEDPEALKSIEENYRTALVLHDIMEKEIRCSGGLFALLTQEYNEKEGGFQE